MFKIRRVDSISHFSRWLFFLSLVSLFVLLSLGCFRANIEQAPVRRDVSLKQTPSFKQDIQPIFNEYCVKCHNPQDAHKGLRLDTYASIIEGQTNGPVIVPGRPLESILLRNIRRESPPSSWMPFHQDPLTPNRVQNIENWIGQGAPDN